MSSWIKVDKRQLYSPINRVMFCRCGSPLYVNKSFGKCSYNDKEGLNCVNNEVFNERLD